MTMRELSTVKTGNEKSNRSIWVDDWRNKEGTVALSDAIWLSVLDQVLGTS